MHDRGNRWSAQVGAVKRRLIAGMLAVTALVAGYTGASYVGRSYTGDSYVSKPGTGGPATFQLTAQREAITGAQLHAQLGNIGHEGVWKFVWDLNGTATPLIPRIGPVTQATAAGTPTFGTSGPLDSFDKGLTFTDGQVAQTATPSGGLSFGPNHFAVLIEVSFSGAAGGNRFLVGHDGTEDAFMQYMQTSNQIRAVVLGGSIGTITTSIAVSHNVAGSHTILWVGIIGANMRVASDLGVSSAVSIAAEAAFDFTSTWRIAGSNAFPGTITFMAVAVSDGTAIQNTAMVALYDNITTVVTNYRTNTGR